MFLLNVFIYIYMHFYSLILGFCYSNLAYETSGCELTSTITLVLQANQLTKCAGHSKAIQ